MTLLSDLIAKAAQEIDAADDLAALDAVRVAFLGKKGEITLRLKSLGQLPPDQRSAAGQEINQAKREVQQRLNDRRETLDAAALEAKLADLSIGASSMYRRTASEPQRPKIWTTNTGNVRAKSCAPPRRALCPLMRRAPRARAS